MAVDTNSIAYLIDPFWQGEGINGKPLVAGYMCVYIAGTDQKYITWQDWDGTRHPFKIPLGSDGRATILVEVQYTYDCYLYDSFGNLVCSRLNVKPAIGGDVSVSGLTQVYHDETISGNGTPYEPLGIVSGGKTYEGIEPIVVNNDVNKISANNVALGLQEPLFFVEDSETACVIGCSAQTEIPSALSGKWDDASDVVIANSAQWSENTEYEAGSYVDIDNNIISITGLQPEGDYAYNSALSSKLDVTALPQDLVHSGDLTAYQSVGNYLSATDSANFILTSDSGKFYPMDSNPSGYIYELPSDLATTGWVDSQGYLTAVDIPESATWNATTQTVSANSAAWAGGTANPQIPVTSTSGISIFESGDKVYFNISANYATEDWVTGQGYLTAETDWTNTITAASANAYNEATAAIPTGLATTGDLQNVSGEITALIPSTAGLATEDWVTAQGYLTAAYTPDFAYHDSAISAIDESALYDTSAHARINTLAGRINTLSSDKADVTALADYQTTAGMTAYQSAGDYLTTGDSAEFYTTANESGFITGVDLTPYQLTADMTAYLTTADSANFYTTANESGYLTAIPDTYLQNTDLTIVNDTVTEISGMSLSAVSDIFWAVYGTTTYEDTLTAYNAGKKIFVYENGNIWPLIEKNGNPDAFRFTKILDAWSNSGPKMQYMILSVRDGWYKSNNYPLQADWNETYQYYPAYIKNKPDLTQYQTTAGMTAYQPVGNYQTAGDYLTTADSANFYTTANESGFITGIPDTYLQNTDLTISDGKVTEISGVPLSAGDEFPQSATDAIGYVTATSANIDSTIDNVSANSGVWGGSALPISAGPGIKFEMVDNTLVASTDETVLYTGNTAVTAFTVSEPLTNFTEVAFYVAPNYETTVSKIVLPMVGYNTSHIALTYHSVWNGFKGGIQISTEYNNTGMSAFQLISGAWFGWANDAAKTGTYNDAYIHKIIGINRIAGE